jgi:superfamily II DNA or RNA helicase
MLQRSLLSGVKWRDYQSRIIEQGAAFIRAGRNPLIEMATGTGKTVTAAGICAITEGRVIWEAHRRELVKQAKEALEAVCCEPVGVEMPGHESSKERLVVASKDSLGPKRLGRIADAGAPSLIVIDECHHSAGKSYLPAPRAFPGARIAGLTATPHRHDKRRLSMFDAATDPFRLPQAMELGWLVPFRAKRIKISSIDLSGIEVVAGDLSQSQLADMCRTDTNLAAVSEAIKAHAGSRPTIVYCITVDVAKRMAELLRGAVVHQKTPVKERAEAFERFGYGLQFLCNVGVATEGTDLPPAACIAMYRPTLSATLFRQMLGRGGRTLKGLSGETPDERKAWIANSAKPDCLVLDFVGNAGKHSVVTIAAAFTDDVDAQKNVEERLNAGEELLASDASYEEEKRAVRRMTEEKERARLKVRITAEAEEIALIGLGGNRWAEANDLTSAVTPLQMQKIRQYGISGSFATRAEARAAIVAYREAVGLATPGQVDFVKKHFPATNVETLTKSQARGMMISKLRKWGKL